MEWLHFSRLTRPYINKRRLQWSCRENSRVSVELPVNRGDFVWELIEGDSLERRDPQQHHTASEGEILTKECPFYDILRGILKSRIHRWKPHKIKSPRKISTKNAINEPFVISTHLNKMPPLSGSNGIEQRIYKWRTQNQPISAAQRDTEQTVRALGIHIQMRLCESIEFVT